MKKVTLLFVISFICFAKAQKSHEISIVKAILGDKVATLNTHLCWSELELVKLFKGICNERIKCRISGTELPNGEDEFRSVILMDLNCEESWKFIENIDFHKHIKLKFILLNAGEAKLLSVLDHKWIGPSMDITFTAKEDNLIKKVYKTGRKEPLTIENYGSWNGSNLTIFNKKDRIRQNLNRTTLRASMVMRVNDSLNHLDDYRDIHIDTIGKLNYILTNHLSDFMNATVNYSVTNTWGYKDKQTSEYNGMIGELTKDTADLGATALLYVPERIPLIQYITRTTRSSIAFVFQAPKLSVTDNIFLLPFTTVTWGLIIALIPVISVSLAFSTYTEWKMAQRKSPEERISVKDAVLIVFGAMCQQGSYILPRSGTARIIMIVCLFTIMFLYVSYSAHIVALLQSPSTKIKTLHDLLESRIKLGAEDTVYNRFFLPRQTEKTRKAIYDRKIATPDGKGNYLPLDEGISRIRKGLYGFYFEAGPGYKLMQETYEESEKCGLIEIEHIKFIEPHYAIQKNSTYHDLVKIGLYRITEHGLQHRITNKLYTKKPVCSGTGGKFVPVGIIDVQPAFLLLCWGFGIAIACGLAEFILKRLPRQTLVQSMN